ncbi:MAG: ABC transporter ATP-binding protein [Streptococcaceae bacterium]|nr:ABC transporter ATP-binding protein [Streptococcaceae bacterium]MCL2858812.1 ABC transporter ATP-binding protein [Streptococcaceae bacterium]
MTNINVKNLSFSYGMKPVLTIPQVEFEQGKVYGIVGKNGVGKTTFFKTLTNIITKYTGIIEIDGVNVRNNPEILSKVGIVLDDMELYKGRTGLFNLRYFGGLRGGFDTEKAQTLAKEIGILDNLREKVGNYSLGMNKKLILLISLMNDADILIFDEPFRGLDVETVAWFRNYLLKLKDQGKMILISSHVQEDIESLADEVFVLSKGDFDNKFDLKELGQTYIYRVEVSDSEKFISLLKEKDIASTVEGEKIKFDAAEEVYRQLFQEAVAQGIEFDQIKKENKFAELVK